MIKLNTKTILTLIIIVIFFIAGFFISKHFSNKKENEKIVELKKQIIKNDNLVKIDSTTYKKLVADTLTKKQLKQKIDSLKIKVKEPKVVEEIVFVPKEVVKKEVDTVVVKDSTVNIVDFYPQKENYFIKYSSTINTLKKEATSDWNFKPKKISLAIGLDKNGMYEVKTKVPEFIKITSIDVQTEPKKVINNDNFGYLIGAGYGTNLNTEESYLNINTGIRYKNTYLLINVGTNNTINGGLTFEF